MSNTNIRAFTHRLRNYIVNTGIGQYRLATTIPTDGGTWVQAGAGFSDTRLEVRPQTYNTVYTATYTGAFTGTGTDTFTGTYSGLYNQAFTKAFTGSFTGQYTAAYTGAYTQIFTGQ